jgi:hypothetical protein
MRKVRKSNSNLFERKIIFLRTHWMQSIVFLEKSEKQNVSRRKYMAMKNTRKRIMNETFTRRIMNETFSRRIKNEKFTRRRN